MTHRRHPRWRQWSIGAIGAGVKGAWVPLFWSEFGGLRWWRRVCVRVRLPFRTVLSCEIGTAEGKPQVEEYALQMLAGNAETLIGGSGPLVTALMSLLAGLAVIPGFEGMEQAGVAGGRELTRLAMQHALDAQAAAEERLESVTGADGYVRRRAETGHARTIATLAGDVSVCRIAYRCGVKGAGSLFPRDAVLNLPELAYSWGLQKLLVMAARENSYEQAEAFVLAATGVSIANGQAQKIIAAAAADAEAFARGRGQGPDQDPAVPLAISADGKGVAVRPQARRSRARREDQRTRLFAHRTGTGEKTGTKRMAETAVVFDVAVPDGPRRTPAQLMHPDPDPRQRPAAPAAANRWYTCGITAAASDVITAAFDHAERRDPGHDRPWIGLVDGNNHQIQCFRDEAAQRGITLTILIDFIHVTEYIWKLAWCFHRYPDPAAETWVTAQLTAILAGNAADVIALVRRLAAASPPAPGSEHDKIITRTLNYLTAKQPYLDYPTALENGWPIATGVIEGACRHLVHDRMGITGARWSLPGAQAILWLRAIDASGDTPAYWTHHLHHEHQRNHLSRYHDPGQYLQPAA
jgi:hypothetical protein